MSRHLNASVAAFIALLALAAFVLPPDTLAQSAREPITPGNAAAVVELARFGRGSLSGVTWSPDGEMLLVYGSAGMWLYDANDLEAEPILLSGHTGVVLDTAISPDGTMIVSSGTDTTVRLWDVSAGAEIASFESEAWLSLIKGVAFSPDGTTVAAVSSDDLHLWDVATREEIVYVENAHSSAIYDAAFSPDGSLIVTGSSDKTAKLWDAATGDEIATFEGHGNYVNAVAFSPDGSLVATGSSDSTVRLWDVATGANTATVELERGWVMCLAFSPDGATLAFGTDDDTIWLWTPADEAEPVKWEGHEGDVIGVAFSPDGATLASASADETVRLWDVASGTVAVSIPGHTDRVSDAALSPDATLLLASSSDLFLRVWDVAGDDAHPIYVVPNQRYVSGDAPIAAFSPDGALVASLSAAEVSLLVAATGDQVHRLSHDASLTALAFSPDSAVLAAGSSGGEVLMWDVATGDLLAILHGHTGTISSLAFSADGALIVTGSADGTARLWGIPGEAEVEPTTTESPPTATAVPPTATEPPPTAALPPTTAGPVVLDATHTFPDGASVNYPSTWSFYLEDDEGWAVEVGSPDEAVELSMYGVPLTAGDAAAELGISGEDDHALLLATLSNFVGGFFPYIEVDPDALESFEFGDSQAVRFYGRTNSDAELIFYAVLFSNDSIGAAYAEASTSVNIDISDADEATLQAIIESWTPAGETAEGAGAAAGEAEPTPAPEEPVQEPGEPLPLAQSYTTANGFTLNYPEGWSASERQEGGGVTMVRLDSRPSATEKDFQAALDPGEVQIEMALGTPDLLALFGADTDATPLEVLEALTVDAESGMSAPYETSIGDKAMAGVDWSTFAVVVARSGEDTVIAGMANVAPGELEQVKPTFHAIVASVTRGATPEKAALQPTGTYIAENGFTFSYPPEWAIRVEGAGKVALANTEAALQKNYADLSSGEVQAVVSWGAFDNMVFGTGLDENATSVQIAEAAFKSLYPILAYLPEGGNPTEMAVGDMPVARVGGVDLGLDNLFLVFRLEDGTVVFVQVYTVEGELAQFEPAVRSIVASALGVAPEAGAQPSEVTAGPAPGALPLTETFTANTGFTVNYPQGWVATEQTHRDKPLVVLGNSAAAVEKAFDRPQPGELEVNIFWGTVDDIVPDASLGADATVVQVLEAGIADNFDPIFETPYEITIGDRPAVASRVDLSRFATTVWVLAFRTGDDTFGLMVVYAPLDEFDLNLPTFLAIAESVSAVAPGETTSEAEGEALPQTETPTAGLGGETGGGEAGAVGGPEDCQNVAASIGDFSSTFGAGYEPANLLDDNPATGWSSEGYEDTEFVVVNLDGTHRVSWVLFNSYSPSPRYETDSIKGFSIAVSDAEGQDIVLFDGEAAFQKGYQAYAFDPVETDHLKFIFTSTYGGGYFEAADIMVCAAGVASASTGADAADEESPVILEPVTCEIHTDRVVNMRSRPGTDYNVAGRLDAGLTVLANGWTTGADGFVWWRLTNGAWVRDDVVDAAGDCESLIAADPEDPLPLFEQHTTGAGYTFAYPYMWVVFDPDAEDGEAALGNSLAAAEKSFGDLFEPGEFQIRFSWSTVDELAADTGLTADATPMQVLEAIIASVSGVDFGEPYELQIDDQVMAAVYGRADDTEMSIVIFDAGGGVYGSALTLSDLNGMEQFEPTVRAIIGSALGSSQAGAAPQAPAGEEPAQADVPALPQTFTSDSEDLTVSYPEGWVARDTEGGYVAVKSNEFVYAIMGLQPGEVDISIDAGITTDPSAMAHLTAIMEPMASGLGFELGEPSETVVGRANAARLEASTENWHLLAVVIERTDGHYFDVLAYTHPEEFAQYEPLIMAIVDSVTYTP